MKTNRKKTYTDPKKKKVLPKSLPPKKKVKPTKKRKYLNFKLVGAGTFGSVYRAKTSAGRVVAIKKVLQDPHYKNRELIMMKEIQSRYCIKMIDHIS